jgi:3-isopropylmalate/(R)-2-methylmalate dehydratase small subunit
VRWRLLQGLDDIGITMQNDDAIAAFESSRPAYAPTTMS